MSKQLTEQQIAALPDEWRGLERYPSSMEDSRFYSKSEIITRLLAALADANLRNSDMLAAYEIRRGQLAEAAKALAEANEALTWATDAMQSMIAQHDEDMGGECGLCPMLPPGFCEGDELCSRKLEEFARAEARRRLEAGE